MGHHLARIGAFQKRSFTNWIKMAEFGGGKMEITFLLPKSFSQKFLMVSFRRPYGHMKKLAILRMQKKRLSLFLVGKCHLTPQNLIT